MNIVLKDSNFGGPVIVKTDANFGGQPEYYNRHWVNKILDRALHLLLPNRIYQMNPINYQVYDSKKDVPSSVWINQKLMVEQYIPERAGEFYCIRICFFFGNVVLNRRLYARSKIIKGQTIERSEPVEVPPQINVIRKEMGFDYGKFDYVIHDGVVHILDANKTPGVLGTPELNKRIAKKLAKGIDTYLGNSKIQLN